MDVCDAVHHAHQNLIIHRDIKPGNIIVVASGQVKLLDFGIAKLMGDTVGAVDLPHTRPALLVMTPEYASPEQVRGESLTTASDVYALGVVLYELLAGRRPYEVRTFSLRELHEKVCEASHEPPSGTIAQSRDATNDGGGATAARDIIATARGTTVERLRRQLRGDVDAIVMMALRKEPRLRYGSAQLLREDIARYLDGRPVTAQRPSRAYHLRKFISRHRVAVAAGVLAAASLATGTAVAVRQATVANLERDRATDALGRVERTLEESEEMTGFLVGLFDRSAMTPLGVQPGSMEDLLRRGALQVERSRSQPLVQARMLDGMGRVYRAVGRYPDARAALERAVALRRANGGESAELATSMVQLADVLRLLGAYPAAESTSREALTVREHALGPTHPALADVVAQLAGLAVYRGALVEAESLARDALARRRATLAPDDPRIAGGLELFSATLRRRGSTAEAEERLEEAIGLYERRFGPNDLSLTTPLLRLAEMRGADPRRAAEAEPLFTRVLSIREGVLGPNHPQTAYALGSLAALRSAQGRHAEAERLAKRVLEIQRRAVGPTHLNVAEATLELARISYRAGRLSDAERLQREAIRLSAEVLGRHHSFYAGALTGLGTILLAVDRVDEAESTFRQAIDIRRRALGGEIGVIANEIAGLADVYARRQDFATADSLYRRAVAILTADAKPMPPDSRDIYRGMAAFYTAYGRPADASRYRELAEGRIGPR